MINNRCECSDPVCPKCSGHCERDQTITLYRVDIEDKTGTAFCDECALDASESGFFTDGEDHDENEETD